MKRGLVIAGVALLVVAAAAGGAYWWVSRPVALESFEEPGAPAETKQQNSAVETALATLGVQSALVDITAERAYVAYDAPSPTQAETFQLAALNAMASAAPEVDRGIAVMYVDGAAKLMWKADLDALRAVGEDEAKFEAFLAGVEKTAL